MRYHWIPEVLDSKLFTLEKIHSNDNDVDMLTKALTREKLFFVDRRQAWWSTPNELEGKIVQLMGLAHSLVKPKSQC